jgi:hypothetical protein
MRQLRRRLFVDRPVQGALVRRVVFHWFSFALCLAVILWMAQYMQNPLESFGDHLSAFPKKHGLVFIVLVLLLPAFLWDTVRLSHRFAGPVLRLRRMMQELAAGEDPGELRFRDGDFWCELGDHFNGIRAALLRARGKQPTASPEYEFATSVKDAE